MTDVLVCPHGMGNPASCVDCMADGNFEGPKAKKVVRPVAGARRQGLSRSANSSAQMEATFSSDCPGCGEYISAGDTIFLIDGDWCCGGCVVE